GLMLDHDGDFRAEAGYEQAKGFVKLGRELDSGRLEIGLAATVLDQETAGFIQGQNAYRDPVLRRENLNPEAYRDADSQRLYARWVAADEHDWAGTDLRFFLRRSSMDFQQHFLPGKPREENSQVSGGVMALRQRALPGSGAAALGFDLEVAHGELEEFQSGESGIGAIPPGQHYDYAAESYLAAPFARLELPFAERWRLQLGLRAEYMLYDYDNRMIDGSTRDDGTPCTPAPCRFSRPEDRSDDFLNLAPDVGLLYLVSPELSVYGRAVRGFRPPQATELYRLQAQQAVADLDSETLDSGELGLHWAPGALSVELSAFLMKKRNYIFQDADRFNVSDGKSRHRGVELQAEGRGPAGLYAGFAGSWSRQTYAFSSTTPGGERITTGDEIDTAPQTLASAHLGIDRGVGLVEIEWVHVGSHYLDAANTARYGGHNLLNLRGAWRASRTVTFSARVNNLADEFYAERADFAFGNYRYFPGRDRELYLEIAWSGP
ncbi:MAG: TonB-dependent receptor, partial [Gammaproteobacteria bacterium]|nr:TonB-dependent receptor [Gammaproteobacteria bacterium]